jgi:hypothetical protein
MKYADRREKQCPFLQHLLLLVGPQSCYGSAVHKASTAAKTLWKALRVGVTLSLAISMGACSSGASTGRDTDAGATDAPAPFDAVSDAGRSSGPRADAGGGDGSSPGACMNGIAAPPLASAPLAGPSNDTVTLLPAGLPSLPHLVPNPLLTPVPDRSSNIYLAANLDGYDGGSRTSLYLVKLKPSLEVESTAPVVDTVDGPLVAANAASNLDGNVVIVGTTTVKDASGSEGSEATTQMYGADGKPLWSAQFRYHEETGGRAVAFLPDGGVVVVGLSYHPGVSSLAAQDHNLILIKYTATGDQAWVRKFCSVESAGGVVTDSAGQIYVQSTSVPYTTLTKFGSDGTPIFDVAFASAISAGRLAMSPDQKAIYLVGATTPTGTSQIPLTIRKLDAQTGELLSDRESATVTSPNDPTAGVTWTGKFSAPSSVTVQADGIYVSGAFSNGYSNTSALTFMQYLGSYDLDGNLKWVEQFSLTNASGKVDTSLLRNSPAYSGPDGSGNILMFTSGQPAVTAATLVWKVAPTGALHQ